MPVATRVEKIRGMSPELAEKLKEHKIINSNQLLKAGCSVEGRKNLAKLIGTEPKALLEMLNRADLDRINGIGAVFADLLEQAGVDTVKELSKRVPSHLHEMLITINFSKQLTRHPPKLEQVTAWVEQAKALPPIIEY